MNGSRSPRALARARPREGGAGYVLEALRANKHGDRLKAGEFFWRADSAGWRRYLLLTW
jgi:hypothetical protein